jgi:hypothetical protein
LLDATAIKLHILFLEICWEMSGEASVERPIRIKFYIRHWFLYSIKTADSYRGVTLVKGDKNHNAKGQ